MANLEAWIAEKYGPDLSKVTEITGAPSDITGKVFAWVFVPSRPSPLSQVAGGHLNKIPKHFLVPFKLPRSLTLALPACQSYSTQATSKCWGSVRSWRV